MRPFTVAVLALVLVLPSWAAPQRHASLQLASVKPLVVKGVGFGRGERVAVVASFPGEQQIVHVTARPSGRFEAGFTLVVTRCTRLTVRALGGLGSRAVLQLQPDCPKRKERRRPR
jgi:hypothetical protein